MLCSRAGAPAPRDDPHVGAEARSAQGIGPSSLTCIQSPLQAVSCPGVGHPVGSLGTGGSAQPGTVFSGSLPTF